MSQKSGGVAVRVGIKGNPKVKEAATGCTEAVTGVVQTCESIAGKTKMLHLTVDVGQAALLTIVSSWDGIVVGSRVVVACLGSLVNEEEVQKIIVGGVTSEGQLCDTAMLGWKGGAEGDVALLPATFSPGDPAPEEKPRRGAVLLDAAGNTIAAPVNEALVPSAPKLSKEDKKAQAALKKAERDAKKKGGTQADAEEDAEEDTEVTEVTNTLPKAPTKELKRIQNLTADKRKKGEEVWTDDELEAAGFAIQGVV